MAGIAGFGTINVGGTFTLRDYAIVATGAGANDMSMVHCIVSHWSPWRRPRLMTGITGVGAANVVSRLATCERTVMATGADTQNLRMIHCCRGHWCPGCWKYRVTCVANI